MVPRASGCKYIHCFRFDLCHDTTVRSPDLSHLLYIRRHTIQPWFTVSGEKKVFLLTNWWLCKLSKPQGVNTAQYMFIWKFLLLYIHQRGSKLMRRLNRHPSLCLRGHNAVPLESYSPVKTMFTEGKYTASMCACLCMRGGGSSLIHCLIYAILLAKISSCHNYRRKLLLWLYRSPWRYSLLFCAQQLKQWV